MRINASVETRPVIRHLMFSSLGFSFSQFITFFEPNIDKKNKLVQTALIEYTISYLKWLLNNLYAHFLLGQ